MDEKREAWKGTKRLLQPCSEETETPEFIQRLAGPSGYIPHSTHGEGHAIEIGEALSELQSLR